MIFKKMAWIISLWFLTLTVVNSAPMERTSGPTPIGLWRTYDLDGVARSVVRFYQSGSSLQAQIVKILPSKGQKATDVCSACSGSQKNKRRLGMVIVWGLKKQGDMWVNGTVLDTDSGKTYRCQVSVSPDNRTLHFKAYVAVPVLGKTINWSRVR